MTHQSNSDFERPVEAPLQIGVFAHFAEEDGSVHSNADSVYERFIDLFVHAESLGFDSAWVRQFHLQNADRSRAGGLPSPFVFLAAVAARTERLRLGTGAVTLPLESPLRVAEDAAVLDVLSGGRVELGVANGGGLPGLAEVFGRSFADDPAKRRVDYLKALQALLDALAGKPLDEAGQIISPLRPQLLDRFWQATLSDTSAFEAAERGHGVLVGTTQTVPAEVTAAAYYRGLADGVTPRLGLSTLIFPGRSRESALREAEAGILKKWAWGKDFLPPATTLAEIANSLSIHYGTAEQIAESIASQPAFAYTTHLQVQVELVYSNFAKRHDALELFVNEIAPALGWRSPLAATV
ncbi:LLM class flavin-dependent oxidoreductase [Subtercola lobariae]|uniref:Luciferase n=1 Tax=Subtercola lobariae TaxID=1588641 RepID=A0A917B505_9MICO|nr:LLM class flavin-dependent oxidoreductase [Subtercola lobariae]GGF22219.1 luciferase [Subtercola lobariae]